MDIELVKRLLLNHEWTHKPSKNFNKVYQCIVDVCYGDSKQANIAISQAYNQMIRLDLGCGYRPKDGYKGVDILCGPQVSMSLDLTKDKLPFEDSTVDAIYSDHFLEHLCIEDVQKVIVEIHRVCKHGALVEIRVPHFSGFTNFYEYHKTSWRYNSLAEFTSNEGMFTALEQFARFSTKINLVNRQSPLNHPYTKYYIWNYPMEWLVNKFPHFYETSAWRNFFPGWELVFKMKVIK